ncbi:fimbria/pilus chaperone family protein [Cronobacter turicensis]|uniref:fimbria/pilus chaperone family protein n=1 Tax=Cronobacter turicensis TaxID=413502 RepID=UPI0011AC5F98|nr:fimbria/pilus chaperone family protein [Cronobacter turicensis]TWR37044.1 fimbria/pilus periplasmic chaperone [Cronobacter turicensis]
MKLNKVGFLLSLFAVSTSYSIGTHAAGMVPETSLLIINESEQGGSINIKNTDDKAELLYTNIVDLPDDKEGHLIVTQPVVRVEGGQTQHLRFILQTSSPLKTEHLKRVTFEGIPQKMPGKNKVGFNIRQDLPVLIHPATLPVVKDAWTQLEWSAVGNSVTVKNPSPYVVRLAPQIELLPGHTPSLLTKSYILPGESITVEAKGNATGNNQVKFVPASRYGVQVESYTTSLKTH